MTENPPLKPKQPSADAESAQQAATDLAVETHEAAAATDRSFKSWGADIAAELEAAAPPAPPVAAPDEEESVIKLEESVAAPESAQAEAGAAEPAEVKPAAVEAAGAEPTETEAAALVTAPAEATTTEAPPQAGEIETETTEAAAETTEATVETEIAEESEPVEVPTETHAVAAAAEPAESENPHVVELVQVCKWFEQARGRDRFYALEKFNFTIDAKEDGAFVVLLGPSGCGKSTVLSLISGLSLANQGEVRVRGTVITGPNPYSATVPQAYTCYPWLTVLGNVEFGLTLQGLPKKERRDRAMEYLRKVDLADRCDAMPKQLSGGMQQRVAIARTLAMRLPIVLMDEPFGALDAQTRSDMQQMVLDLWDEEKNTIIFVTHDISEALLLGDRVVVFSSRPAKIIYDEGDLDSVFGHKRPPDVVRMPEFVKRHEQLRQLLKKPHTGNGQHDEVG